MHLWWCFSWCTLFTGAKYPNDASYYQFSGILLHWIIIYFFVLFFPVQILLSALIIFYLDNELIVHIPILIFSCSFYLLLLLGPFCKMKMTHMAHFKCTQLIYMLFPILAQKFLKIVSRVHAIWFVTCCWVWKSRRGPHNLPFDIENPWTLPFFFFLGGGYIFGLIGNLRTLM